LIEHESRAALGGQSFGTARAPKKQPIDIVTTGRTVDDTIVVPQIARCLRGPASG
jgi:hypothetical protein